KAMPAHTLKGHRVGTLCVPERSREGSKERHVSWREYWWLAIVGVVIVTAVFVVRANARSITSYIYQNPVRGVCLYIVLNILDAVAAPGAALPLIPVAAHAWGRVSAGLVTTAGWTAGSLI